MSGRFPQSFLTRDHIIDCSEVKFETVRTLVLYQYIQRFVFGRINHLEKRDHQFPTLKVLKIEKNRVILTGSRREFFQAESLAE